jgi:hypothetical protein
MYRIQSLILTFNPDPKNGYPRWGEPTPVTDLHVCEENLL